MRGVRGRGELVTEPAFCWCEMAVGEEKWYSKLAGTMDACVITVVGRLKVKVGEATASILDVAVTDLGMPLKTEFPPNGGISKICLGGSIVAAFFLDSFSTSSSNGLLLFLLLFSSFSRVDFSFFSLFSFFARSIPLVTGVGAARLNIGMLVIGRGRA